MTLSVSEQTWFKPTLLMVGLPGLVTLWAYLGGGLFMLGHHHAFNEATPLTLYQYWAWYGTDKHVQSWLFGCTIAALLLVGAPIGWLFAPAKRSLFGDARFAKPREVREAGLNAARGIIVGLFMNSYLVFGGSQHVIISAPTRSGKGVGIVIPNLLSWPDSVVVLDIKQENHARTSGYRRKCGHKVYLWNPLATDYRTHRYNPLAYISDDPNFQIDDIQKIAGFFFPDLPGTDPIWTATPRSFFLGVVLSLRETPGKLVTIGQVLRESLADGDGAQYFANMINVRALGERVKMASDADAFAQAAKDVDLVLADKAKAPEHHPRMLDMAVWGKLNPAYRAAVAERVEAIRKTTPKTPDLLALLDAVPFDVTLAQLGKSLSPACVRALNTYITISSDNTRSGIITSFRSRLELWNNPLVDASTSGNDFDFRDLRRKRMAIYVGVTPDNLERVAPLLNLFWQQLVDANTRVLPEFDSTLKYQVLLNPDEFTAMGKIPCLAKGISYIAGYGLRLMPIIQSPAQVVEIYGEHAAETFSTNHALQIVFPPKRSELKTAQNISEWLGYQTVKSTSESKGAAIFTKREKSENNSDAKRALLLPQEITSLGKKRQLVVVEDCPPIMARRIRYYEDPMFIDRLKTVSPSLKALDKRWWRKLPTKDELDEIAMRGELAAPVPLLDLVAHERMVGNVAPARVIGPAQQSTTTTTVVQRPVTAEDVPNLGNLALSDFAVDFSGVSSPASGELDIERLHAYADDLCRQAGIKV